MQARAVCVLLGAVALCSATLERCHILCDSDENASSSVGTASRQLVRGKMGPKGAKGEPGEPSNFLEIDEALHALEKQLRAVKSPPRDCFDIKFYNSTASSGVYTIFPPFHHPGGLRVYCDMDTDGGGWLVFQNRFDGSEDFYRGWVDYLYGFGDLSGEFWLGLEEVHQLTKHGNYDMRIDLTDFENETAHQVYSSFYITGGPDYALDFEISFGTAGQALLKRKFTTKDMDQDTWETDNCAERYKGAWWHNQCHNANLNGMYLSGETEQFATGMVWAPWKGYRYSLKTSQMKFRPLYD